MNRDQQAASVEPLFADGYLQLWALEEKHIGPVHRIISSAAVSRTWRSRGRYWSPAETQARLGSSFDSAVATVGAESEVVGLAELTDVDFEDRRAQLGLVTAESTWGTGTPIAIALRYLEYIFRVYPLEKIGVTAHSQNQRLIPGLRRLLPKEGHFVRHINMQGEWLDLESFAIFRSDFDRLVRRFDRLARAAVNQ